MGKSFQDGLFLAGDIICGMDTGLISGFLQGELESRIKVQIGVFPQGRQDNGHGCRGSAAQSLGLCIRHVAETFGRFQNQLDLLDTDFSCFIQNI